MIDFKIVISQRAFSNIIECVSFVKNVSLEAANELYQEIIKSIGSLSTFPNKYQEIENLRIKESKVRKMPIHKGRYVILYKVESDTVVVYDIIDARKDNILSKI